MNRCVGAIGLMLVAVLGSPDPSAAQDGADSCVSCHEMLSGPLGDPALAFAEDVHAEAGFGCAACHGGDPTVQGPGAMDEAKGYIGRPSPEQVPDVCGRCHSNAGFMRQYNPALRVDQVAEYVTSVHGQRLLGAADTAVATCMRGLSLRPGSHGTVWHSHGSGRGVPPQHPLGNDERRGRHLRPYLQRLSRQSRSRAPGCLVGR